VDLKKTTGEVKDCALKAGADLIGITPADFDMEGETRLENFIKEHRSADMSWLEDYKKRVHPKMLLPSAKSIIVIGINYCQPDNNIPPTHGRIARYAYGRDYHKVIKGVLKKIGQFIKEQNKEQNPEVEYKLCVDSAPILEKSYAVKAGLGFIGKNTTLITPEFGSFVVLGELITNLEFEYDKEKSGTCGTCTRCIDSCPTKALIGPCKMDARRCISYLTIENKKTIPKEFRAKIGNRIFGCDTCQESCPYNQTLACVSTHPDFKTKIAGSSLPLKEIISIRTEDEFVIRFAGSPLMRAKLRNLKRNAKIAQANAAD
jgi:epoxyqueuosine reductase